MPSFHNIGLQILRKFHVFASKYAVFRYIFYMYVFIALTLLDVKIKVRYKKSYDFVKAWKNIFTKGFDSLFAYETCNELANIIEKTKRPDFFQLLYPDKCAEASISTALAKICAGQLVSQEIKNIWSKRHVTDNDCGRIFSFLNSYPNYALKSLISWLDPRPDFIIRRSRILEFVENKEGAVLDIGCSFNPFLDDYHKNGNSFVVGVDLSSISLRIGKILDSRNVGRLVCGNCESLPFENSSFDIVVCSEVMEHVANPEMLLSEISRVLKKNSSCILSVPMHVVDIQDLTFVQRREHLLRSDPTHRPAFFSYNKLIELFEKYNLHVVSTKKNPYYIFKLKSN